MPKNIVHVLSSFYVGGAERLVLDLAQLQSESGDSVAIFSCNSSRGDLYDQVECPGVDRILSSGRLSDYKALWKRLSSRTDSILHIHSPWALRYLILLIPLLRLRGNSIVYTRHGIAPLASKKWRLIHRLANYFVSWVTFVSDAGKQAFFDTHRWNKSKLVTISNGVFVPEKIHHIESDKLRIGSVGRMVALKGQKDLIKAVSQLEDSIKQSIEIHFFGDGPESEQLKALASNELSAGQCLFHGMELDRDKVYGAFDVLAVCSEQEGLSLAIMEAMAREIPVIATRVGDSPKLALHDVTGLLYEYADVEVLKQHLTSLVEDAELRVLLGEQARKHMIEKFSLKTANAAYQLCYDS